MFIKGEHERQFAYEAHTACDKRGFILGVEVTAGNIHDSVAWDKVYDDVTSKFDVQFVAMDAGYKTPWIAKKTLDDGKIPVLPYTRYKGSKEGYRPWDYKYDPVKDVFTCPHGQELRHTTTDRDGKRIYRSTPKYCVNCLSKSYCKANEKGQKVFTTHIWQEYLDIVESIRKTDLGKQIYAQRKETIERVFADAKEKHAMRYTHHRGLAAVTRWVRLKFAAMNLKKLAQWSWKDSMFSLLFVRCCPIYKNTDVVLVTDHQHPVDPQLFAFLQRQSDHAGGDAPVPLGGAAPRRRCGRRPTAACHSAGGGYSPRPRRYPAPCPDRRMWSPAQVPPSHPSHPDWQDSCQSPGNPIGEWRKGRSSPPVAYHWDIISFRCRRYFGSNFTSFNVIFLPPLFSAPQIYGIIFPNSVHGNTAGGSLENSTHSPVSG